MDPAAPPVVRGEFLYRDTLFVDVGGDGKRHPRALESELNALLTGKSSKDQVGHWYEAQLIHYGLPRSKDKNTAKVRLQQALNQGKLKVPPHLLDMENQMKKDYTAAVRRERSQSKGASATKNVGTPNYNGRKRTNGDDEPESSKRTKVSMTIGDMSINIDHAGHSSSGINPTTKESRRAVKPSTGSKSAESDAASKSRAFKSAKSSQESRSKQESKRKTTRAPRNTPRSDSASDLKSEKVKKEPPSKKRATPVKKERRVKSESPSPNAYYLPNHSSPGIEPSPSRNVTGTYELNSAELAEQFLDDDIDYYDEYYGGPLPCTLSFCVDNSTNTIWGSFSLAQKSGVLRIDNYNADSTMTFGWRARDESQDEGRLQFGRGCFGEMELYGREQVRGSFMNLPPRARVI